MTQEGNLVGVIELENMEFYAYHGCFKEEQVVGNRFVVNATIETECVIPAQTDNIEDALNYVTVYELIKEQIMINAHLLENVTKRMVDAIYAKFPHVKKVSIKVSKMNPPMGGQMKCVSITFTK